MIDPLRAQVLSPTKDEDAPYPIPAAWRQTFREIVRAFVEGDYRLSRGLPHVRWLSAAKAEQIREYVADYGETLVELPEDTWRTSESQWMNEFWDVLVDLWTVGEGRSDLALTGRVFEIDGEYEFEVHSVYVP